MIVLVFVFAMALLVSVSVPVGVVLDWRISFLDEAPVEFFWMGLRSVVNAFAAVVARS